GGGGETRRHRGNLAAAEADIGDPVDACRGIEHAAAAQDELARARAAPAHNPPVTSRIAPSTYDDAAESSHSTASAISSGSPARCSGAVLPIVRAASIPPWISWMSVRIGPGRTALTRIPSAPTSRARPLVKLSTAPLLAA